MTEIATKGSKPVAKRWYSLTLLVPEDRRSDVEQSLIASGLFGDSFAWKERRRMSPYFGGQDRKAKYRANEALRRAAGMTGVSHDIVSKAGRIKANAPEMFDQIKTGTLGVEDAIRRLKSEGRWKKVKELR